MEALPQPEDVGLDTKRLERIDAWIERYLDTGKLPGATVLVARHGQVAYCKSFGFRDMEEQKPMTESTILRFCSMTKPITTTALMMLYEKGLFQLDDPVADFIPSFADLRVYVSGAGSEIKSEPVHEPMTIHHLLTHTSGLTYGFGNEGPIPELYRQDHTDFGPHDGPLKEVVDRLAALPLEFHPGHRSSYGVSTDVAGRVVEV